MNTMGKTLVIINFVFALLILAFVAAVAVTSTNWKKHAEDYERELKVYLANSESTRETDRKLKAEVQNLVKKADDLQIIIEAQKKDHTKALDQAKENTRKAETQRASIEATQLLLAGQVERLQGEIKALQLSLKGSQETVIDLQTKKTKAEELMQQAFNDRDAVQLTSATLLERVRELEKFRAMAPVGNVGGGGVAVKDPNQPNPPPAFVKGIIEKIDSQDRALVQISIGTDAGVDQNNTLEVYRLQPRPEYLGMIRIVNATHNKAIGRLMRTGRFNGGQGELRAGDEVASEIRR